jgi:hypothetical protein
MGGVIRSGGTGRSCDAVVFERIREPGVESLKAHSLMINNDVKIANSSATC